MITIYPDQFNLRENGSYSQLEAIKGADGANGAPGPQGPQGEPGVGIGTAEYVPQVILSEVQPSVANGTVWVKLLSTDTGYTLGNVMCGTDYTLPSTRWDGTALQKGDVYIIIGDGNNHPVTWGSITFCPFKCYLRITNNTWDYREAEVYVSNAWWPLNAEWLVENGDIIGASSIPTEGASKYTVSKDGNYLVLTGSTTVGSRIYITCSFGDVITLPCTYHVDGEIITNTYTGQYGLIIPSQTGAGTSSPGLTNSVTIPANTTATDPSLAVTGTSPGRTIGLSTAVIASAQHSVIRIRHLYRVFNS